MQHLETTLFRHLIGAFVLMAALLVPGHDYTASAETAAPVTPLPTNAPYAKEINAFQERDKKQMPPAGAVLFLGSSSIRLWDTLAQDFAEIPVINRGFGGSEIADSVRYADRITIPYKPKMIVMYAGTNDIGNSNKPPQQLLKDFTEFADKIHQALPDTRLIYVSINPSTSRWKKQGDILEANHLIEKWIFENNSKTRKLSFINSHSELLTAEGQPRADLLRDGLHLTAEGYKVWSSIIKPRILALAALDGVTRLDAPPATAPSQPPTSRQ